MSSRASQPVKLPFLVSIPHGGHKLPSELHGRTRLQQEDIFWDSDACTRTIYASSELVHTQVETDIARAAVDLSRSPHDLPPTNPDGVVKQTTCLGVDLYSNGCPPGARLARTLVERYHVPWHRKLESLVQQQGLLLALDCHSMLAESPPVAPDRGRRPSFCVSNNNGQSCDHEWVLLLASCLARAFELSQDEVQINDPFQGGYITTNYGRRPLPWIQIEMSRALYLQDPWFDSSQLSVAPDRLAWLNARFHQTLCDLAAQLMP